MSQTDSSPFTSLEDILKHPASLYFFQEYLKSLDEEHYIKFWSACNKLANMKNKFKLMDESKSVYDKFIKDADKEIELADDVLFDLRRGHVDPSKETWQKPQAEVLRVMKEKFFDDFEDSGFYCAYLHQLDVDDSEISGTLQKMGEKGLKGWKTRWFKCVDFELHYYKSEGKKDSQGFIDLKDVQRVTLHNDEAPFPDKKHVGCGFQIETEKRTYNLSAETPLDRLNWIKKLKRKLGEVATEVNGAVVANEVGTRGRAARTGSISINSLRSVNSSNGYGKEGSSLRTDKKKIILDDEEDESASKRESESVRQQKKKEEQERLAKEQEAERKRKEEEDERERLRLKAEAEKKKQQEEEEKEERERLEKEEQERKEQEEKERKEQEERERKEKEEQERKEREQREEEERIAKAKAKEEEERLERERKEKEEKERKEKEEKERLEREKKEREEKERLEKERLEKERLEKEQQEKEEKERKEREEKERLEREQKEREEKERLEKERLEKERLEKERKEREKREAEEAEREKLRIRLEKERQEEEERQARLKKEREEKERKEKEERERLEREEKERKEKLRIEQEEKERLERERVQREEDERKAREEEERKQREEEEKKRQEQLRLEAERKGKEELERYEREQKAREEKERQEREAREKKEREEKERKEREERERIEREERQRKEREEAERKEKEEKERKEREERERKEKEEAERKAKEEKARKDREEQERLKLEERQRQRELERQEAERKQKEAEKAAREKAEKEEKERKAKEAEKAEQEAEQEAKAKAKAKADADAEAEAESAEPSEPVTVSDIDSVLEAFQGPNVIQFANLGSLTVAKDQKMEWEWETEDVMDSLQRQVEVLAAEKVEAVQLENYGRAGECKAEIDALQARIDGGELRVCRLPDKTTLALNKEKATWHRVNVASNESNVVEVKFGWKRTANNGTMSSSTSSASFEELLEQMAAQVPEEDRESMDGWVQDLYKYQFLLARQVADAPAVETEVVGFTSRGIDIFDKTLVLSRHTYVTMIVKIMVTLLSHGVKDRSNKFWGTKTTVWDLMKESPLVDIPGVGLVINGLNNSQFPAFAGWQLPGLRTALLFAEGLNRGELYDWIRACLLDVNFMNNGYETSAWLFDNRHGKSLVVFLRMMEDEMAFQTKINSALFQRDYMSPERFVQQVMGMGMDGEMSKPSSSNGRGPLPPTPQQSSQSGQATPLTPSVQSTPLTPSQPIAMKQNQSSSSSSSSTSSNDDVLGGSGSSPSMFNAEQLQAYGIGQSPSGGSNREKSTGATIDLGGLGLGQISLPGGNGSPLSMLKTTQLKMFASSSKRNSSSSSPFSSPSSSTTTTSSNQQSTTTGPNSWGATDHLLSGVEGAVKNIMEHVEEQQKSGGDAYVANDLLDADMSKLVRIGLVNAVAGVLSYKFKASRLFAKDYHLIDFIESASQNGSFGSNDLSFVSYNKMVNTLNSISGLQADSDKRFRAFVCESLNRGQLGSWLGMLGNNSDTVNKFFEEGAFMRRKANVSAMMNVLEQLESLTFDLDLMWEC